MDLPVFGDEPSWNSPQVSQPCLLQDSPNPYHPSELCLHSFASHSPTDYQNRYLSDFPAYHEDLPSIPWMDMPPADPMFRQHKANELLEKLQQILQGQQPQQPRLEACEAQVPDHTFVTNAACASCYRSKLSCDKQRPCSRCVKGGRDCVSRVPVKLGRPRKRDPFLYEPRQMRAPVCHNPPSFRECSVRCDQKRPELQSFPADPWIRHGKESDHHRICERIAGTSFAALEIPAHLDFRQQKTPARPKLSPKPLSRKRPWGQENKRSSVVVGQGGVEFNLEGGVHEESFFDVSDAEWVEMHDQSSSLRFALLLTCEIARVSESLIEKCSRNYMIVWSLCSVLAKQTKKIDFVRLLMQVWSGQSVFPRLISGQEEDDTTQHNFHQLDNLSLTATLPPEIISLLDSRCVMNTVVVLDSSSEVSGLPFAVLRMWDVLNQEESSMTTHVSSNRNFVELFGYEGQELVQIISRCAFFEQVVIEEDWPILIKERVTSLSNHIPMATICVRILTKFGGILPVVITFHRQWAANRVYLTYAVVAPTASPAIAPSPVSSNSPSSSAALMLSLQASHALPSSSFSSSSSSTPITSPRSLSPAAFAASSSAVFSTVESS